MLGDVTSSNSTAGATHVLVFMLGDKQNKNNSNALCAANQWLEFYEISVKQFDTHAHLVNLRKHCTI